MKLDVNHGRRLFIVGVGRSGTSLLQSMLASHLSIKAYPETSLLRRFIFSGKLGAGPKRDRALRQLLADKKVQRIPSLPFIEDLSLLSAIQIYQRLIEGKQETSYVLDKDPKLIEYLPLINGSFDEYRAVHIYRDPRDVLSSKKKAEWSKHHPSWYHVFAYKAQEALLHKFAERHGSESVMTIKYEELIHKPEDVLGGVCSWLGLEFQTEMLAFQSGAKKLVAKDELSWKEETKGPLLANNFGKWKVELTGSEILLCESVCAQNIRNGGYELSQGIQINVLEGFRIRVFSLVLKALVPVYCGLRSLSYRKYLR